MNTLDVFYDPKPDRSIPRYSWSESLFDLNKAQAIVAAEHRKTAIQVMERIMAKVDNKSNYRN